MFKKTIFPLLVIGILIFLLLESIWYHLNGIGVLAIVLGIAFFTLIYYDFFLEPNVGQRYGTNPGTGAPVKKTSKLSEFFKKNELWISFLFYFCLKAIVWVKNNLEKLNPKQKKELREKMDSLNKKFYHDVQTLKQNVPTKDDTSNERKMHGRKDQKQN